MTEQTEDEVVRDMELVLRFGTDDLATIIFNGRCPKCFQFLSWKTERSSRRRIYRCSTESCTFFAIFPKAAVKYFKDCAHLER